MFGVQFWQKRFGFVLPDTFLCRTQLLEPLLTSFRPECWAESRATRENEAGTCPPSGTEAPVENIANYLSTDKVYPCNNSRTKDRNTTDP
jgi:hypothetical protein